MNIVEVVTPTRGRPLHRHDRIRKARRERLLAPVTVLRDPTVKRALIASALTFSVGIATGFNVPFWRVASMVTGRPMWTEEVSFAWNSREHRISR